MLQFVTPVLRGGIVSGSRLLVFIPLVLDDLLQLLPRVARLGGEWAAGHRNAQDVGDHVRAQPAHQRRAAGIVVGLFVIEKEPVYLQEREEGENWVRLRRGRGCPWERRAKKSRWRLRQCD